MDDFVYQLLNDTLEDLRAADLEKFKFYLSNPGLGFDTIGKGLVEKANSTTKMVTLMVDKFMKKNAVDITIKILSRIGQNTLADTLRKIFKDMASCSTTLINPVENLEDRMCKKHDKLFELFCRKDQTCVCLMCMSTDHKTHDAVPLEEECRQKKAKLRKMKADVDQMVKTRSMKVQEIKLLVETRKRDTEREISYSLEVITALVSSLQSCLAELIQLILEKQKATEKQAEGFIKELEQEITELKMRSSELEQLSHSEDHLHLLQSFTSLSTPPHTKDWSQVSVDSELSVVGTVRRALSQLEDTLIKDINKKACDVELKMIQQYVLCMLSHDN